MAVPSLSPLGLLGLELQSIARAGLLPCPTPRTKHRSTLLRAFRPVALLQTAMSGKYAFTKGLKELRFLHCQTSEHSNAIRYVLLFWDSIRSASAAPHIPRSDAHRCFTADHSSPAHTPR